MNTRSWMRRDDRADRFVDTKGASDFTTLAVATLVTWLSVVYRLTDLLNYMEASE